MIFRCPVCRCIGELTGYKQQAQCTDYDCKNIWNTTEGENNKMAVKKNTTEEEMVAQSEPSNVGLIYGAMANIMTDVDAIVKTKQSSGVSYAFRSVDDVMNSLHPILAKHKVFIVP